MNRYFAKYLPVEGEIKEGDKYITEKGEIYNTDYIGENGRKGTIDRTHDKKVKLFLCSRDIPKMGDYVVNNLDLLHGISERELNKDEIKDNEYTKVIGEILTLGIVENQEFTEKEAEFLTIGENIS